MASVTLNQELDSSFLKGLRLLHSSEPDAEEQLQQLWKQAVIDKYGSERIPTSVLHKVTIPTAGKRENQDANDATSEAKRPKLESSAFSQPPSVAPAQPFPENVDTKDASSDEDGDKDSPLEILNNESVCKKCKATTSSTSNKLVECVDCHKHYHQLCHFPPISDMDFSDPRFVWYCSSCDQNITTTTSDKTKANSSKNNAVKTGNSTKGASSTSKSSRIHSASSKSAQGSGSRSKSSESKRSCTPEKKGHMMKKRSTMKKPDKKKSTK